LNLEHGNAFISWLRGFYKSNDYECRSMLNIASFCLQMKEYIPAERFFLEVLSRSNGQEKTAYYALAEIYQHSGDKVKAEICHRRILLFDKNFKSDKGLLSSLPSGLADSLKKVPVKDNETMAKIFFNNGNDKLRNGDINGALADYDSAIARKPDYDKAYINRANIKSGELKKDKEALTDFDKAIELKPDCDIAYLGRGSSKYNLKDYEGACGDWRKAAALGNKEAIIQIKKNCR
jgi:tetratricopeptide (TPR) repeat protein